MIFVPKIKCSPKKGLHFESISDFIIFVYEIFEKTKIKGGLHMKPVFVFWWYFCPYGQDKALKYR